MHEPGGTAAIVLLPHRLVVAEGDATGQDAPPAAVAGPGGTADTPASGPWPRLELNPGATLAEAGGVQTQIPVWSERPGETTVPIPGTARPDDPKPASADAQLGLPRRLRQASLAPQLRDAPVGRVRRRPARGALGRAGAGPDLIHPAGLAPRGRMADRRVLKHVLDGLHAL